MASRISDMINPQAARFESGTFYQHYHMRGQYPSSPIAVPNERERIDVKARAQRPDPRSQTPKAREDNAETQRARSYRGGSGRDVRIAEIQPGAAEHASNPNQRRTLDIFTIYLYVPSSSTPPQLPPGIALSAERLLDTYGPN